MEMENGKQIDAKIVCYACHEHFYNPKKKVILLFFGYIWSQMEMQFSDLRPNKKPENIAQMEEKIIILLEKYSKLPLQNY